jgi:ABC-type nitrate/sulfonate/bicarbonate transport system substrate-binding protein
MLKSVAAAGALFGAVFTTAPALAQTHLDIVTFGGTSNLPIWIAMDRGLFAKEGLDVKQDVTKGSVAEIKNMMAGKYQIGTTSFDNSIAYTEGQADVKIDDYDIVGIMGVHSGMNSVVTTPEVKTHADIKGKVAASDALNSGYGVMLFAILDKHGLKLNRDYTAIAVGSGPKRLEAMQEGKAVVAALSAPEDTETTPSPLSACPIRAARMWCAAHGRRRMRRKWRASSAPSSPPTITSTPTRPGRSKF